MSDTKGQGGFYLRFIRGGTKKAGLLLFISANASILMCVLFSLITRDLSIKQIIPAGIGIFENIKDGSGEVLIPDEIDTFPDAFKGFSFAEGILIGILNAVLALGIHEAGHIISALLFGCGLEDFKLKPVGLSAKLKSKSTPKLKYTEKADLKTAAVTAGGSFLNILIFTIIWLAGPIRGLEIFAIANIFMGIFNLIPALPLDGGWLLFYAIEKITDMPKAYKIMYVISIITGFIIIGAGIIQFILSRGNFSIAMAGIYILYTAVRERSQIKIICTAKLLMRNLKPEDCGAEVYPGKARISVASAESRPSEIIGYFDPGAYNIVCVLNNNMQPLGFLTEKQLTDAAVVGDGALGTILMASTRML